MVEKLLEADLGILLHQNLVLTADHMLLELLFELIDDGLCSYFKVFFVLVCSIPNQSSESIEELFIEDTNWVSGLANLDCLNHTRALELLVYVVTLELRRTPVVIRLDAPDEFGR